MKHLLETYTGYNLWANRRMAERLAALDPELLDAELKSSFPTLRRTVHHIWDAEIVWLSRMEGKAWTWPPTARFKSPGITEFTGTSLEFANFTRAKGEDFFHSELRYNDSKGRAWTNKGWEIVMHCMNHSSYHRGQLITLLRELGVNENIPSTDLIGFFRR
ncbi:MAG: DinB family protein [Bacteroidota bacterium]